MRVAPEQPDTSTTPEGERKTVTALFADIKGSPEMGERIFRAIAMLNHIDKQIRYAEPKALFYIGWKDWTSTRDLELALQRAASRIDDPRIDKPREVLQLADLAVSEEDVAQVEKPCKSLLEEIGHSGSLWTFGSDRKILIAFDDNPRI